MRFSRNIRYKIDNYVNGNPYDNYENVMEQLNVNIQEFNYCADFKFCFSVFFLKRKTYCNGCNKLLPLFKLKYQFNFSYHRHIYSCKKCEHKIYNYVSQHEIDRYRPSYYI